MSVRMTQDNCLIVLEPAPTETASGIAMVHTRAPGAKEHRTARVLSVGPGHHPGCKSCGGQRSAFIPTTLVAGDRILVSATCGHKWDMDVSAVRQNEHSDFDNILGERGEFRIIREAEAHAVLTDEQVAAE